MKQTAVEFLVEMFDLKSDLAIIDQAKEMEKQQKGYSEKEVVELNLRYLQELGKNGNWMNFKQWFELNKKK